MGGKTAKRAYLAETLRSFDRGGGIGDIAIREQGSTFEEDYKEAMEWIGEEKWNNMNLDERKEATYMLKAKGYIGYPDWYEDVETISAMQYAKGGGVDRYNLSFNYNPSVFKTEDAKAIVKKYTSDWSHDNDLDEVSFYVQGLSKEKVEELSRELKMEDVYNIEYELSRYKYAKGGGVKEIKKFKVGDKVVYTHKGKFGWEDLDEAKHYGYDSGINEVTEVDYSKGEESIKLNNDDFWVHPNHFELSEKKYAKGGGIDGDLDKYLLDNTEMVGEFDGVKVFDIDTYSRNIWYGQVEDKEIYRKLIKHPLVYYYGYGFEERQKEYSIKDVLKRAKENNKSIALVEYLS